MAVGDAPWYSLSWDQWVGVAGLPLTLSGLWLAWIQARAARRSADAARNAVYETQKQLVAKYVQLLVPQLAGVANDLTLAISANDVGQTRRYLYNWRYHANNVHGL